MPPKIFKNKGKIEASPTSGFEIDVDKIPQHHRETLDISIVDDYESVKYYIQFVIDYIRSVASYKGAVLGSKRVISVPETPSNDNFFLLTIVFGEISTKLVFHLYDIYVYGFTCNGGIWYYPIKSKYTIKDGIEARFRATYPTTKKFKIGVDVLRQCVSNLYHNDPRNWSEAYYDIVANIAESVRFHFVLQSLLRSVPGVETELIEDFKDIINNWSELSKLWKLLFRYDKWNPQRLKCDVTEAGARSMLCIVKNDDISSEIRSLSLNSTIAVVDQNVK